jgi:hypothetical protein
MEKCPGRCEPPGQLARSIMHSCVWVSDCLGELYPIMPDKSELRAIFTSADFIVCVSLIPCGGMADLGQRWAIKAGLLPETLFGYGQYVPRWRVFRASLADRPAFPITPMLPYGRHARLCDDHQRRS